MASCLGSEAVAMNKEQKNNKKKRKKNKKIKKLQETETEARYKNQSQTGNQKRTGGSGLRLADKITLQRAG